MCVLLGRRWSTGCAIANSTMGVESLRAAAASPAAGYAHVPQEQQKTLVEGAFGKLKGFVLTK